MHIANFPSFILEDGWLFLSRSASLDLIHLAVLVELGQRPIEHHLKLANVDVLSDVFRRLCVPVGCLFDFGKCQEIAGNGARTFHGACLFRAVLGVADLGHDLGRGIVVDADVDLLPPAIAVGSISVVLTWM